VLLANGIELESFAAPVPVWRGPEPVPVSVSFSVPNLDLNQQIFIVRPRINWYYIKEITY
jgi:hypothetical protein